MAIFGFGFTVILNEMELLVHPLAVVEAVIAATAFVFELFIVVKEAIFPFPFPDKPIKVFVLFHENVEPAILLENEMAVELSPAQIV